MNTDKFPFLSELDAAKPDEVLADGSKVFSVRCRHPFSGLDFIQTRRAENVKAERVVVNPNDGQKLDPSATGNPDRDSVDFENPVLFGTSSSTSVDFYGTEMSKDALEQMAAQMSQEGGIPYLPRHNNGMNGAVEWDEVMGRTLEAKVMRVDGVKSAFNGSEDQYVLQTKVMLYKDDPNCQKMIRALDRGQRIGQSIGGWFTQLQFVQNSDKEIERVIVRGIELDHLAATRAPANPDSNDLGLMRSVARSILNQLPAPAPVVNDERAITDYTGWPLAPENTPWSWVAADQDAVLGPDMDWERYKRVHAYYDPQQADLKQGYKLPFAKVIDGRIHAVWRGVAAVMGILLGARGGVDISDADRRRAYDLMVRYYEKFGKTPPEFRMRDAAEVRHILAIEDHPDHYWVKFAKMAEGEQQDPMTDSPAADEMAPDDAAEDVAEEGDGMGGDMGDMGDMGDHEMVKVEVCVEVCSSEQEAAPDSASVERSLPAEMKSRTFAGETQVERKMSDINIDALAALLDAKLAPLAERVAGLEAVKAPKAETVEDRLAVAEARAAAAEAKLNTMLTASHRVGRSVVGHVGVGAQAVGGLKGVVEANRTKNGMVATVADHMVDGLNKRGEHIPADLPMQLGNLLDAAVAEGLITTPDTRASWA